MSDDDAVVVRLSATTLAALQEFLAERKEAETAHTREAQATDRVTLVTQEDWELSQFWYDADTCRLLASEVYAQAAEACASSGRPSAVVACISCPSTYKAMLARGIPHTVEASILEYDRRFGEAFGAAYGFYDYTAPSDFPPHLRGCVDVAVIDPPFLQDDCLSAYAATLSAMARPGGAPLRVVLCTGAVMLRSARSLLDVRPVRAPIRHEGGRLSNPFALYLSTWAGEGPANRCGGWDTDAEAAAAAEGEAGTLAGGGALETSL